MPRPGGPSSRRSSARGRAVELAIDRILKRNGYETDVARPTIRWNGKRCGRCKSRHPMCGSVPRTVAEDFFGCVDIHGVKPDREVRVQSGGLGSESKKRKALDGIGWLESPNSWLVVVTRDGRAGAGRNTFRAWERSTDSDYWTELEDWKEALRP